MTTLAQQIRQGAEQAWESLAEGWRDLGARATSALTRLRPAAATAGAVDPALDELPPPGGWAFMPADVIDQPGRLVVRLEAPGLKRDDFSIELEGRRLRVRGEKRLQREHDGGHYRLQQSAWGLFQREWDLPVDVRAEQTQAQYEAGVLRIVLRIVLPKAEAALARFVPVTTG